MKNAIGIRVAILAVLAIFLLTATSMAASYNTVPQVLVDGKAVSFDSPPIIENGRMLVPLGAIFEALGAKTAWNAKTKTITATKGKIVVTAQVGNVYATVSGKKIKLDTPPKLVKGRILASLKFVGDALGCHVKWDSVKRTATITTGGTAAGSKEKSLAGLWMGLVYRIGQHTRATEYMVMYEDGTFYYGIPPEGLYGFDRKERPNTVKEFWGTYTFNGTKGTWKVGGSEPQDLKIDKNGSLTIGLDTFYPCKPVDGLRLNGAWTVYADPENLDSYAEQNKPVIRFTADGKFIDEGLFSEGGLSLPEQLDSCEVDEEKVAPGRGAYEIKDFTLILKYDDGRVRKAAFSLYLGSDKQPSPEMIYIYRRDLYRM